MNALFPPKAITIHRDVYSNPETLIIHFLTKKNIVYVNYNIAKHLHKPLIKNKTTGLVLKGLLSTYNYLLE